MTLLTTKILRLIALVFITSCTSYKPIFDQNNKFISVGKEKANRDFLECKRKADIYLEDYKAQRAWNESRRNLVKGGIVGGVFGFLTGKNLKYTLTGASVGALMGGIYGGLSVMGEDKVNPDQIKKNYITNCLNNQQYQILGWY
ncbi:MAG: hypothetical protein ACO201_03840 [Rickettsiales bacterium]